MIKRHYLRCLRWLYPELSRLDSDDAQYAAWNDAVLDAQEDADNRYSDKTLSVKGQLLIGGSYILAAALLALVLILIRRHTSLAGNELLMIRASCGLLYIAAVAIPFVFVRRAMSKRVRRQLLLRGIRVCVFCGYDLSGLKSSRCPECGCARDPALDDGPTQDDRNLRKSLTNQ